MLNHSSLSLLSVAFSLAIISGATAAQPRTNVILIVADDLRPELGCYGSLAKTPHIDSLAKRGVLFERAYCQQALCNPSRSSFMTGQRPDSLGLWCNGTHFRDLRPNVITIPEVFKKNGYVTRDVGKIFHNWHTAVKGDPQSWSAPEFLHYENHGNDQPKLPGVNIADLKNHATAPKTFAYDVPDEAYFDGRVADEAIRVLKEVKDQPFFLAVGFWKPHAPFNAPKKYWDRYERTQLPKLDPRWPKNGVELARHEGQELLGPPDKRLKLTDEDVAEWRHGYFANTSYLDDQVGKFLRAVEEAKLNNTYLVFVGDHGYHLGEHELWAKTSCYELDARVPLIVVPPSGENGGSKVLSPVELIDLFPTLIAACGLTTEQKLDGKDLSPALTNATALGDTIAFTQHPRPAYYDRTPSKTPTAMGYSVKTVAARYTEWRDWNTGKVLAMELYEHASDPHELNNTSSAPADPAILQSARTALHRQFPPEVVPAKTAR
ncbi:Choline-sulfatase [Anatilimnocola aggregata]|uniref:Choline-sulfatase n=1 Tax=Anatilimnocola aggregata TaxID=2528021 RepID=A0A517YDR0_9BACT|nr:sulfatase [Anatilimnocola aggregata]QDU28329.1 Choline-sulfatase [Anatilimnocola aggregata]